MADSRVKANMLGRFLVKRHKVWNKVDGLGKKEQESVIVSQEKIAPRPALHLIASPAQSLLVTA